MLHFVCICTKSLILSLTFLQTACPHVVYDDGVSTYCYFLFGSDLVDNEFNKARDACNRFDPDATLAEIDSQAKVDHLVALNLFAGASR